MFPSRHCHWAVLENAGSLYVASLFRLGGGGASSDGHTGTSLRVVRKERLDSHVNYSESSLPWPEGQRLPPERVVIRLLRSAMEVLTQSLDLSGATQRRL